MTGKELKAIRKKLGLSQREFAARIKTSRVSVTRMEYGSQVITPSMGLLVELLAKEIRSERSRKRSANTSGDEAQGLGQGRSGRTTRRQQSHTKKNPKRRNTEKT